MREVTGLIEDAFLTKTYLTVFFFFFWYYRAEETELKRQDIRKDREQNRTKIEGSKTKRIIQ